MKKQQNNGNSKKTFTWICFLIILTAEGFVFTWSRVQCTATGYALTRLQDEYNRLMSLEKNLIIERAHLRSPERITAIATQRMGLKMPDQNQILTIKE